LTYLKDIVMFGQVLLLKKGNPTMSHQCPTCGLDESTLLNPLHWKLAASGAGVIVYQVLAANCLRVLLSRRASNVGVGLGITGGGFVECLAIDKSPVGTVVQTSDEAHREGREENAGFETVVSEDEFLERAQPIATLHVRTADENRVHGVTMFALRARDDAEWNAFAALPPGVDEHGRLERDGELLSYTLEWYPVISRREPELSIMLTSTDGVMAEAEDFFHRHEFHAIASIAWYAHNNKLW
jgi:hypothetical protein